MPIAHALIPQFEAMIQGSVNSSSKGLLHKIFGRPAGLGLYGFLQVTVYLRSETLRSFISHPIKRPSEEGALLIFLLVIHALHELFVRRYGDQFFYVVFV